MNFDVYFKDKYKDKIDEKVYYYIHREDFETSIGKLHIENDGEMTMYVYATICLDYYEYQDFEDRQYLTVKCYVDLENEDNFYVVEIVEYEKTSFDGYCLDSYTLVPYIYSKDYDRVANDLLKRFFSSNELKEYISPVELAHRMGLNIQYHVLSIDGTIFGLTCFKDCNVKIFDDNVEKEIFVKKGTIIVDRQTLSEYGGFESENFTITHECVHWYIHRKYFYLENDYFNYVCCSNEGIISNVNYNRDELLKMEYQANGIAARVLLPYVKIKTEFISLFDMFVLSNNKIISYERCIDSISRSSSVSREAVKIRLKEIGYKVDGIYEFVDGKYLQSYLHDNTIDFYASYSISLIDYLKLIMQNKEFSVFTKNNNYLFIDNHLCFKNKKYISEDNKLTNYALEHIDECCVLFEYKRINGKRIINNRFLLFRANSKGRDFYIDSFNPPISVIKDSGISFEKEQKKIRDILERIHGMNIHYALRECREALRLSQENLADKSAYSTQTIKDIENRLDRSISIENILRLSYGMGLPKEIIYRLLNIGNHSLDNEMSPENAVYRYIVDNMQVLSVKDIDLFLIKSNMDPLFYSKEEYN